MRILVISDTHGKVGAIAKVIEKHSDINNIFFLGDLTRDIEAIKEEYKQKNYYIVSGNCDGFSFYKNTDMCIINSVKILFTHGHTYGVKGGIERLCEAARQRECKLVLFGHTHAPLSVYDNGVTVVNPGSLTCSRQGGNTYAIIDVLPSGIVTSIMQTE